MPTFKFRARDRSGKATTGTIDAPSAEMAGNQLFQTGFFPIAIEEASGPAASSLDLENIFKRFKKVKQEEIVLLSQQLSTLYKAGLPLLTGLRGLKEQTENKKLQEVLEEIIHQIEEGSTLYGAISKYPDVFPLVYINMVRAGETSGRLGESLDRYVILGDRELRTQQKIKEGTRYPKLVVLFVFLAFFVLLTFVIPRFAEVFSQFKTPLPLPTRVMLGINSLFHHYWYIGLGVIVLTTVLVRRYTRTEEGKIFWDKLKMKIPGLGRLFIIGTLSRFAHTFVMLNKSGIPLLQTLEITSTTLNNVIISKSIIEIGRQVRQGRGLADSMKETGHFTPLVIQMVGVGETTGTLDDMLTRITEYYDIEMENAIKKITTYIEPALTVFMAVVVLFLALAVFLPWWNMYKLFK